MSSSINKTTHLGNLTRDPELRYTPTGSAVCDLSIACNRVWYDDQKQKKEEVTFLDITVWGKTAENCATYLAKGLRVLVEGRLQQETWEDKATGQKRSKLKIVADTVTFIDFKEVEPAPPAEQARPQREYHGPQTQNARPTQRAPAQPAQPARRGPPVRTIQYPPPQPDDGSDDIPF